MFTKRPYSQRYLASCTIAMLAFFGMAYRRGGPMTTVAAFTIASTASRVGVAAASRSSPTSFSAAAARSSSSSSLSRGSGSILAPHTPFLCPRPRISASSSSASSSSLASSIVADDTASSSSITKRLEKSLTVEHASYEVVQRDVVSEYGAYCTLFRHKKSGAELLSVSVDDDNKVFGITLRTPPEDSTGVPHILEHSVLCGSRKYKTKDPFVQLLQGSLQTFLNAFTYPDRTCYVVASQNLKDFYNLINVYADAVYHPRAVNDPFVHAQEGWHLELEKRDDPLTYKGVVYNEMKGVYSSPDSLLNRASMRSIFPDNTYGVDSGGDPKVIPELSFEQFAEFHSRFYHPSNSRIYFSGDDDVYARLELMDGYLDEFQALPEAKVKSRVAWQPKRFDTPLRQIEQYPIGDDQPETHMLTVNWLINDKPMTAFEELAMGVMDHLLMGTTSAILRKTLMESGLGDAVTGGGLSDELLQATYSVGLKGVQPDKTADVERLIQETIEKVARDGFEEDDIASSLNTIEFQMREFNTGSFPKGLSLMLGSMSKWIYDDSPTEGLKFEEPLAQLKKEIAESGSKIFQDMVTQFLVNNKHRSTVELKPSKTLESEILKDEETRLAEIKSKLNDEELDEIIEKTNELKRMQAADDPPEARATIPSLELSDLKRETTEYPIEVSKNENGSGVTVVRHEMGSTSGIAYVNLAVDISRLSLDDVALLPLFTQLMTEAGAGDYDSVALSRRIGTHTGGVGVSIMTSAAHAEGADESLASGGENLMTKMIIQGKATTEKVDELFDLFQIVLKDARLDSPAKTLELLKQTRAGMESRIQRAGHSIANTRMVARHRVGGYVDEQTKGLSYLQSVKKLIIQAEEDWPSLLARLENIRNTILDPSTCRNGMILDITADKKVFEGIKGSVDSLLQNLPGDANGSKLPDFYKEPHPWVPEAKKRMAKDMPLIDEGIVVATQVSYVGKSGMLYDEGERIPGSAAVVSRFLRTGYLWDRVRVMGGAYGGFCSFSSFSGFFSFSSYRDPNLAKTIDVYDAAADALFEAADALEEDPEGLATAIIGTIGDMDSALSPDQKGYTALQRWMINESAEYRQKYRDEILNTKPSDFREFAERLKAMKNPSVAVVSSKPAFQAAAAAGKEMKLTEIF